ncbi:hypothetical protein [Streptomyces sp. NPDC001770]
MLIAQAVLETSNTTDFSLWPVADLPSCGFMALTGRMSSLEVGSALAAPAEHNARADDDDVPSTGAGEAIRGLLETDKVIAPGGLRIHDTRTGVTVRPGCCCGLEDWREWADVADGETVWLGHDPSPRLEHADGVVRLWQVGADAQEVSPGQPVEIAVGELPALLRAVREGLRGFLALTGQWAARHVPALAGELVARLDEGLDHLRTTGHQRTTGHRRTPAGGSWAGRAVAGHVGHVGLGQGPCVEVLPGLGSVQIGPIGSDPIQSDRNRSDWNRPDPVGEAGQHVRLRRRSGPRRR